MINFRNTQKVAMYPVLLVKEKIVFAIGPDSVHDAVMIDKGFPVTLGVTPMHLDGKVGCRDGHIFPEFLLEK